MRAIVVLTGREGAVPADFAPLQAEEARHVWALQGTGQIRAIHFRADRLGVVIEMEVATAEEAEAVVRALPMVQAGLLAAEVIPLRPFTGLEVLFAPEHRA